MYSFGSFGVGICHGSHQEPQNEGPQVAALLLFWVRKVEGGPKEIGAFGGCYWVVRKDWEGLVQREGVGGSAVPNEAGREVGA